MPAWNDFDMLQADRSERIERLIRENPGIDKSELFRRTNSISGTDRQYLLDELVTDGYIRVEVVKTKGRPKTRYWPISRVTQQEGQRSVQGSKVAPETPGKSSGVTEARRRFAEAIAAKRGRTGSSSLLSMLLMVLI